MNRRPADVLAVSAIAQNAVDGLFQFDHANPCPGLCNRCLLRLQKQIIRGLLLGARLARADCAAHIRAVTRYHRMDVNHDQIIWLQPALGGKTMRDVRARAGRHVSAVELVSSGPTASMAAAIPLSATCAARQMASSSAESLTVRSSERMWVQSATFTSSGLAWGWVNMPIMD